MPAALIPEQRRQRIVELLEEHIVLSVRELTEMLSVSHMTVRRDIAELEAQNRALPVSGGVRVAGSVHSEPRHEIKASTHLELKRSIAAEAATRISAGDTVYLDAGTTASALVPHLAQIRDVTVVTNDFTTAGLLMEQDADIVHVGGHVDTRNRSGVGRLAAATLRQINVDLALLSASSWDRARGVTTPAESKVDVKHAAMEVSSRSLLLVDSTKYGTFAMHRVAPLDSFDEIITDASFDAREAVLLAEDGVTLTRAPSGAGSS